jgi:hypothetical protein
MHMPCVSFVNGFPVPTPLLEAKWIDRLTRRHDDGIDYRPLFPACCHKGGLLFVGLNPAPVPNEQYIQFYSRNAGNPHYDYGQPPAAAPQPGPVPAPLHGHFTPYPLVRNEVARLLSINREDLPWSHLDAMMVRTPNQNSLKEWIWGHLPQTVEQLKLSRALIEVLEPRAVIICGAFAARLLVEWDWTLPDVNGNQQAPEALLFALNNQPGNNRLPIEQAQPVGPNNPNLGVIARWVILNGKRVPLFINAPLTGGHLDNGSLQQLAFDLARAL